MFLEGRGSGCSLRDLTYGLTESMCPGGCMGIDVWEMLIEMVITSPP